MTSSFMDTHQVSSVPHVAQRHFGLLGTTIPPSAALPATRLDGGYCLANLRVLIPHSILLTIVHSCMLLQITRVCENPITLFTLWVSCHVLVQHFL